MYREFAIFNHFVKGALPKVFVATVYFGLSHNSIL